MMWAKVAVTALAWLTAAPLPQPRTEVGAALLRGEIMVVGGLTADGVPSARAEAFSSATGRWRRLPNLPAAVHHPLVASGAAACTSPAATAAARRGGAAANGVRLRRRPLACPPANAGAPCGRRRGRRRRAALRGRRRRRLPASPAGPSPSTCARTAGRSSRHRRRASTSPVTAAGGGSTPSGDEGGLRHQRRHVRELAAGATRWRRLPDVPAARGGTGASGRRRLARLHRKVEEPPGTIASVYAGTLRRALAAAARPTDASPRPRVAAIGPCLRDRGGTSPASRQRRERVPRPAVRPAAVTLIGLLALAGCCGASSNREPTTLVATLGDSITAGSPGYDPDPRLRETLASVPTRKPVQYWARRHTPACASQLRCVRPAHRRDRPPGSRVRARRAGADRPGRDQRHRPGTHGRDRGPTTCAAWWNAERGLA
jgi:hypothetical protein